MLKLVALCALFAVSFAGHASAQTSPAASLVTIQSSASTNAFSLKAAQGHLYGFSLCNTSGTAKFFKFYNKATAPVVGTDVVAFKVMLPANSCRDRAYTLGTNFTLGIAWAITGGAADSDTTAVAAGDVVGALDHK